MAQDSTPRYNKAAGGGHQQIWWHRVGWPLSLFESGSMNHSDTSPNCPSALYHRYSRLDKPAQEL